MATQALVRSAMVVRNFRPPPASTAAHLVRPATTLNPESTAALLEQVRDGDDPARERLIGRYLPMLRHWASGRLPARARGPVETDDLVQVTLIRALDRIRDF